MCVICEKYENKTNIVMENDSCFAIRDENPVNFGHTLIAPINCKETYFELTYEELKDMDMLIKNLKRSLDITLKPDAYNIGFNNGIWAGDEFGHCVAHLMPRYAGDVYPSDLKGGVVRFKERIKLKDVE